MSSRTINIAVADSHALFRQRLSDVLTTNSELNVIGQARTGKQLLEIVSHEKIDIAITDLDMPEMDGTEATKIITKTFPGTAVIAFSTCQENHRIMKMLHAGAKGYLLKTAKKSELFNAIKTVNEQGTYYCTSTSSKLIGQMTHTGFPNADSPELSDFTPREISVIKLICRQYSSKDMAGELGVTTRSIESTRERIQHKIGAKNMIGIALYAIKFNLVAMGDIWPDLWSFVS